MKWLSLLALLALPGLSAVPLPLRAQADVVEVVVSGRQPGPPLWRVTNGDNTLWILPLVSSVPRDMEWDDQRLRTLLADTDEYISPPDVDLSISKLVLLNPVNLVRGYRLARRLGRNPGDSSLQEVLPAELYARFGTVKQQYFPRDKDIENYRPAFAAGMMLRKVLDEEGLTNSADIRKHVERLLRRNRQLRRTDVTMEERIPGGYGALRARAEAWAESLPAEQELQCFTRQLALVEQRLPFIKEVANDWASGAARDMEDLLRPGDLEEPCLALMFESSEGGYLRQLQEASRERWLAAASSALQRNRSTFTMLGLGQIIGPDALALELARQGYTLHTP